MNKDFSGLIHDKQLKCKICESSEFYLLDKVYIETGNGALNVRGGKAVCVKCKLGREVIIL